MKHSVRISTAIVMTLALLTSTGCYMTASGRVVDMEGAPVAGAMVMQESLVGFRCTGIIAHAGPKALTDGNGCFDFRRNHNPRRGDIKVNVPGYYPSTLGRKQGRTIQLARIPEGEKIDERRVELFVEFRGEDNRRGIKLSSGEYCAYDDADLRLSRVNGDYFLEVPGGRIIPVGDPKAEEASEFRRYNGPITDEMRERARSKSRLPWLGKMKGGVYYIELPDGRGIAKISRPERSRLADGYVVRFRLAFQPDPAGTLGLKVR